MTDNEIKKALDRLKTTKDYLREQYQEQVEKCPYPELKPLAKQTYEDNKKAFDIAIKAIEKINRLQAENERLKEVNKKLLIDFNGLSGVIHRAKAEAYKEFAERLKQVLYNDEYILIRSIIDNLLKETVGEERKEGEKNDLDD